MTDEQADGGIFINYRQHDGSNGLRNHAAFVEALSRRFVRHFGASAVFVDTSMSSGTRYPDELRTKLTTCHALVAIIHPEWLDDLHQRQDKLGPDWVLEEIGTALNGSPHIRNRTGRRPVVIPVLLEKAELPDADELPEEIRELAGLKSFRFRSGSLADDVARLIEELEVRVPASWRPSQDDEPKKSDESLPLLIVMAALAAVGIGLQLTDVEMIVTLFALMNLCTFVMAAALICVAILRISCRRLHLLDKRVSSLLLNNWNSSILLSTLAGTMLTSSFLALYMDDPAAVGPVVVFMFLVTFIFLLLVVMAFIARQGRQEREWPPRIPTQRVLDQAGSLRDAVVLLERRLTSSWRPPLSRVQRDQAQYIVRQLSKAAGVMRGETERSRVTWLRAEHRPAALAYAVLLTGTVGLAVTVTYLLIDRGHIGRSLYLAVLTPVLALAMCLGTIELWFRYERKRKSWLAAEIEESLEKRLLPHLPPGLLTGIVTATALAATNGHGSAARTKPSAVRSTETAWSRTGSEGR